MPLIAGGIVALATVAGVVLFWGAETLSIHLLSLLAQGDEDLMLPYDEGENPGLPPLKALHRAGGLSLPARVGLGWILWLVDWLEGRSLRTRQLLWGLALRLSSLFVRLGSAVDKVRGRRAQERVRRQLGRRLLYELVIAHRGQ